MDWDKVTRELNAKLHPDAVRTREQAGLKLQYIEGWWVISEANRIFGFDGWSRETLAMPMVAQNECRIGKPPNQRDGWAVTYTAKVRVQVGGVVRYGCGAGHGRDVDLGLAHESALKEAETDATKRALMTFGNPFGLALYDKAKENVGIDNTAEIEAAISNIKAQPTLEALGSWWKSFQHNARDVAAVGDVIRAKDARKADLARAELHQGAG